MTTECIEGFDREIVECRACPRLVEWRERVASEKRKAFSRDEYWGRAVPNFGDPQADRLIVGLAPAAHGANRTGRMFTGDRSGDWLFRALHKVGIANQAKSESLDDGLRLQGTLITALVHCAPPDNKPLPTEFTNCRGFFRRTLRSREWRAVLCLGGLSWNDTLRELGIRGTKFGHGAEVRTTGTLIVASYHPSQQNTFTGRLTEQMFDDVVRRFAMG